MTVQSKKEQEAIKKIDAAADIAQERLLIKSSEAEKIINAACEAALRSLALGTEPTDRRNINGSYKWTRNTDERLRDLEICNATTVAKFSELIRDCDDLKEEIKDLKQLTSNIFKKISDLRDDTRKDKIKIQQYIITITVGLIITFISGVVFGYLRI